MTRFAIVTIVVALVALLLLIYPSVSHSMPYREPSKVANVTHSAVDYHMSNAEIRLRIEKLTGVKAYRYKERDLHGGVGKSNLFLRLVVMDCGAEQDEYIEDFCHELLHIKHFTKNERFVTYRTFVTLYESEFRQVAINMAWEMQNGVGKREYNCLAQICDYMSE